MSEWKAKRFWKDVSVEAEGDGWQVLLDGRPVRTPLKTPMILPTREMAEAVAAEWTAQEGEIDPLSMPVTRSANAALDKVTAQHAEVAAMLAAYAETDTVSAREARRVFGRPWSAEEEVLSGQFRRGLSAVQRSSFHRMIKRLAAEFRARYPHAAAAPENAQPAWHLRLAGSAGSVSAAAGEMWRAMWLDPAFTLRWCKDRWL